MRHASFALALATTGLALATAAPALAAPAAHSAATTATAATNATTATTVSAMASWRTLRHEALPPQKGYFSTHTWNRPSGARVMQVKARCWGNDSNLKVNLWFLRKWGAEEKIAKSGTWRCNGKYGIVRISNAGHSLYWATFSLSKKHTVEYWVQYYK
ncbi:hypothetical protein [Nonomuraea wenchangensis]|uniref:hypothetical protein n=1 Tax=Nonomuraea wenchangensis TaxID=568860 RepID=UPI0033219E23